MYGSLCHTMVALIQGEASTGPDVSSKKRNNTVTKDLVVQALLGQQAFVLLIVR